MYSKMNVVSSELWMPDCLLPESEWEFRKREKHANKLGVPPYINKVK